MASGDGCGEAGGTSTKNEDVSVEAQSDFLDQFPKPRPYGTRLVRPALDVSPGFRLLIYSQPGGPSQAPRSKTRGRRASVPPLR
jgi:hypothetical protein